MRVTPVILCGGSGTRLWPLSRKDHAKQHVPILGGESPFQRSLQRLDDGDIFTAPIIICSAGARFMAADQARDVGMNIEIVLEPEGRDTLAAIAAATEIVHRRDPEATLFVMPSDHIIPDAAAFRATAAQARDAASGGALVTLGLTPSRPATSFGYIKPGAAAAAGGAVVTSFIEKPDAARAAELIADGCLWNAGMFCFRADAAIREIEKRAPDCLATVRRAIDEATDDLGAVKLGAAFADAQKLSFDYGVMEKTDAAVVIAADFTWSDIGDWREIWSLSEKDENGVACEGDVITLDSSNAYLRSSGKLVCAIGVKDLAVVDTPDALMVVPLDRTQEVKGLVAEMQSRGRREAIESARVHRPWGWYQTMDLGDRFRVKRIQVSPGKKLSLQKHHHRAEHWVVVKGTAEVTRDDETLLLRENESVYLPLGCVHRLANPGRIPVEIIEVQTGAYLEEDDIVRIEDDFGRG